MAHAVPGLDDAYFCAKSGLWHEICPAPQTAQPVSWQTIAQIGLGDTLALQMQIISSLEGMQVFCDGAQKAKQWE